MSDFLTNLVRRGAGLPQGIVPTPPYVPDLYHGVANPNVNPNDDRVDLSTRLIEAESRPAESGIEVSTQRTAIPSLSEKPLVTQSGPIESESPSTDSGMEAVTQEAVTQKDSLPGHSERPTVKVRTQSESASPDFSSITTESPDNADNGARDFHDVREKVVQEVVREEVVINSQDPHRSQALDEDTNPQTRVRIVAPASLSTGIAESEPTGQDHAPPMKQAIRVEPSEISSPRSGPEWQESDLDDYGSPSPTGEPTPQAPLASGEEIKPIVPRPRNSWELGVPPARLGEAEAVVEPSNESPPIEVRIGRIEFRVTSPPKIPRGSQRPRGFGEFARARNYADRKWY